MEEEMKHIQNQWLILNLKNGEKKRKPKGGLKENELKSVNGQICRKKKRKRKREIGWYRVNTKREIWVNTNE